MLGHRGSWQEVGAYGSVVAAIRRAGTNTWDRFAASDPGLLRLMAGLRTVGAIVLTLLVLALLGTGVPLMVAGAMVAMVSTFAIREKEVRGQAVTLALGLPVALTAMSLGALLHALVVAGDVFFVLLIFGAVYSRRFGDRGTALGLIGFQVYFISLFVHASVPTLPVLYLTLAVAFGCSALVRFAVVPQTPQRTLGRLREAFRARLAQLLATQHELLDVEPDELDKVLDDLRRHTARLHEAALMIQGLLEEGTRDEAAAGLIQRRVAEAEIAAERLGMLLLNARSAGRADTLTMHLPHAPVPATGTRIRTEDDAIRTLRRDLNALLLLIARTAPGERGTALAHVRNRLLGYRDEDNLPPASPPSRTSSAGSVRPRVPSWVCGWHWTGRRTSPTTARPPRAHARSSTPRTSRSSSPRRPRSRRTTVPGCNGPPPGPRSRSPWARPWP